jgi:glutamate carboxypeptidase
MKGGLVVALFALKALHERKMLHHIPIRFVVNSEEEIGSPVSTEIIVSAAHQSLAALVFECGGIDGQVVTGRKGKLGFKLEITGAAGHAAVSVVDKASAIVELAHKILAFEKLNGTIPGLSVNIGRIQGGIGANTVPEEAWALGDVRISDQEALDRFHQAADRIVEKCRTPDVNCTMRVTGTRPAMPETAQNRHLYQRVKAMADQMQIDLGVESRSGVSDANTISSQGVAVVDGMGPVGAKDHSDQEYIVTRSLSERTALASAVMAAWTVNRLR